MQSILTVLLLTFIPMIKNIISANENVTPNDKEIAALREYFPACFSSDGSFDIERFKEYLSDKVAVTNEGYELRFLGKNYARLLASLDTTTVIVPNEEHNSKPENANSQNIYISGDNLDGLKHLLKSFYQKVKCIYIDPPYNTGKDDFVYKDSFNFTAEELADKLSISDEQAKRILDLTKRGSASHSAWLMFMYSRLLLARDLLSDDGVVFISINDDEYVNLKLLLDDVFGEENFLASFCKKGSGGRQDSAHFAIIHEYVLCYARSKFKSGEQIKKEDVYPFSDERGCYKTQLLRKWGDAALQQDRPNMYYPLYYDGTSISLEKRLNDDFEIYPMIDSTTNGRWRWGKDTMRMAIEKGLVTILSVDGTLVAYEKIYKPEDGEQPTKLYTTWLDDINNNSGRKLLNELFDGTSPFEYPKPVDLIKRLLKIGNATDGYVVDFFSGSATTAHAVMELNAEDGGNRTFIAIQWKENCKETSQAFASGFTTVDQIGLERIIRATMKIREEHPDTTADLGFRHFTLMEPSAETLDKLETFDPKLETGFMIHNTVMQDFGVPTVLATWLVRDGYGFTAPVQSVDFAGYTGYYIDNHLYLINSFDVDTREKSIAEITDKIENEGNFNPENVVIYGYSFTWSELESLKINLLRLKDTEKNLRINFDIRY